ncbi:STAS domain-containing protein [Actinomadura gamaensis]|uniref:Anti-sigma factor antagonist n=1 Tax=Actinomadura gamaensis TaxID=1763541 RepID=A0ABV9U682_9ACTN
MQQVHLRVSRQPTGRLVSVAGVLDLATAPALERCLQALLDGPGGQITVDLSAVRFIDGRGLTVLLFAQRQARAQKRLLLLATPAPRVRRLLQITRTEARFAVYPPVLTTDS